jgi:hypothetical protein
MDDFPDELCGLWIDEDGKAVYIVKIETLEFKIAIIFDLYEQFENDSIRIDEHLKQLTAKWVLDEGRNIHRLQIEAGIDFIGPTYNLYVSKIGSSSQDFIYNERELDEIRLIPEVQMGLYDDWEDDLGVPWAFPYKNYQKATIAEEEKFQALIDFDEDGLIL